MIAFLDGAVEFKGEKFFILSAGGVGYKIFAGTETLKKIPAKGVKLKIWTHLCVREDVLEIYGFLTQAELELFEILIGLTGIGPKGGLGILNLGPVDVLKKAIAAGDVFYLTKVSGIGRKTASKIILELKDKMAGGLTVEAPELKEEADVLEALISLGYSANEARTALGRVSPEIKGMNKRLQEALRIAGGKE